MENISDLNAKINDRVYPNYNNLTFLVFQCMFFGASSLTFSYKAYLGREILATQGKGFHFVALSTISMMFLLRNTMIMSELVAHMMKYPEIYKEKSKN